MQNTIPLAEAFRKIIFQHHKKPVISHYELVKYLFDLYQTKTFDGVPVGKISVDAPDTRVINKNINEIIKLGLLRRIDGFNLYGLSGWDEPSPQQIICTLNPFCYLSYFSAMEWHGITDRIPKVIYATTCSVRQFQFLAKQQTQKDFDGMSPPASIPRIAPGKIDGRRVEMHSTNNFSNVKELEGSGGVRVTSLGRTFLDMLKEPTRCGGFRHILQVFSEHAEQSLPLIVREIDRYGNSMDKARTGYILEERLGLSHEIIDNWKQGVQRGGSRKLVASEPYASEYSETWYISINIR